MVAFLGIELAQILYIVLAFVGGWIAGSIIKLGIKIFIVIAVVVLILVGLGYIGDGIFTQIAELISIVKPLLPSLFSLTGFFRVLSLPLIGFLIGMLVGVIL